MRTLVLTSFALMAFAANSVLCRLALRGHLIDPVSFTAIRLLSGAAVLWLINLLRSEDASDSSGRKRQPVSWSSSIMLFVYAIAFSMAYVSLATGTGALLLFGSVQLTMMTAAMKNGERLSVSGWFGFMLATTGLVYLVLPGLAAPDPRGAVLMSVAGVAWGLYSLAGKGSVDPVGLTAVNFARTLPAVFVLTLLSVTSLDLTGRGLILATVSGAVTSGIGYVVWYRVLPNLATTQAAVLQLLVPAIAAAGGIAFLQERFSARLAVSGVLIVIGVTISVFKRVTPVAVD